MDRTEELPLPLLRNESMGKSYAARPLAIHKQVVGEPRFCLSLLEMSIGQAAFPREGLELVRHWNWAEQAQLTPQHIPELGTACAVTGGTAMDPP